jgi:CBS domain containing-hemolysin-like protein
MMGNAAAAHAAAITISYIVVSGLHILIGEQVPKIIAITYPERAALAGRAGAALVSHCAAVRAAVDAERLRAPDPAPVRHEASLPQESAPSEAEVRLILDRTLRRRDLMPLRRLLLIENVFDFGEVKVRDEMRAARAGPPTCTWTNPGRKTGRAILSTTFPAIP